MTFSYTQISQYLACPRRYRYQYLEGWQEKDSRAAMLFGRAFERALAAYFLGQDAIAALNREWSPFRGLDVTFAAGDSWQRMLYQGKQLLERVAADDRVRVPQPQTNLQIKYLKRLDERDDFLGFVDAIGTLDGHACLIDWKTSSSIYAAQPTGVVALDPQLICYSWLTGVAEVALVVFVRKRQPEIQYLRATITQQQRADFGQLVHHAVRQIQAAQFHQHSGIRFPQNQCTSCAFLGLCLRDEQQIENRLTRKNGADFGWLDELVY